MAEADSESEWREKISAGIAALDKKLAGDLQSLSAAKSECQTHETKRRLLLNRLFAARWRQVHSMLRNRISVLQPRIDDTLSLKQLLTNYPFRIEAARKRYQSKRLADQQRRLARIESREEAFRQAMGSLSPNRRGLRIRNIDYKRGNPVDNFIRRNWMAPVSEAYDSQCFVCKSQTDLTLDHLWIPKNEGGNFAMCKTNGGLLISNVLLLCRSCNSAKGEKPFDQFFSRDQLSRLIEIQQSLSRSMMSDDRLCRVAQRW